MTAIIFINFVNMKKQKELKRIGRGMLQVDKTTIFIDSFVSKILASDISRLEKIQILLHAKYLTKQEKYILLNNIQCT